MTSTTRFRLSALSTPIKVNALAMLVAIGAIVWQIAVGVDYPTVPPGPIILGISTVVVVFVWARWARVVGIVVPLFLLLGGTIASIADDDNAIRHPDDIVPFIATALQLAAVVVALVAGVVAAGDRES